MLKTYKYRIYPNVEQQEQLAKAFGCVRFVYNLGLETKIAAWTSAKKTYSCIDLANQMKELKDAGAPWLKDCPSQALQMSLRNLDNAYTNFFKRGNGFPKFKNKHGKQSLQFPQGIRLEEGAIFIPKLKLVSIDLHRPIGKGEMKTATLSRTTTGKYFISLLIDNGKELPTKKSIDASTAIGVDLGIKDLAITSDGKKFENKDFFRSKMKELRIAQRSLARKKKGSGHYCRQKQVVALLHEKIGNQRRDYLHKISRELVDRHDTICLEDLSVADMTKDRSMTRAISDMGWRELRSMLEYKAEWAGKNISIIGRFDPSSKMCSCCGKINRELKLSDRKWICICGIVHDRDINAAINIKQFGLRNQPGVSQREATACA
jgi:putative transposase